MGLNSFDYMPENEKSSSEPTLIQSSDSIVFSHPLGESDEWRQMVCDAAYFIAQQRNFAPGSEIDDWLAAESQVASELSRRNLGNSR